MTSILSSWHELVPSWAEAIWRATWQGGLVIAMVWAICRYWPTLPARWRCWLWRLAFIKMLLCLVWSTPLQLPLLPAANTALPGAIASEPNPSVLKELFPQPALSVLENPKPESTPWGIAEVLMAIWVGGVVLGFVRMMRHWRRTSRMLRCSTNVSSASINETGAELTRLFGLSRAPHIRAITELSTPLVTGLRQSVIMLPQNALAAGASQELRMMLAHELAHLRRADLWWNWLALLTRCLFFFHPLVWLAKRESELAQEMAADAMAVTVGGVHTADYAQLLVEVTAGRLIFPCPDGAIGILGSRRNLKRRISAMKCIAEIPARQTIVAAFCVSTLGLLLLIPWRVVAKEPGTNRPESATTEIPATPHRLEVETPDATAGSASIHTVTVDVNGRYSYDRHAMELGNLVPAIKRDTASGQPIRVLVVAHPKAQVHSIVALLDALKSADITNISLATTPNPLPKTINIDFGPSRPQPSEQVGPAAVGEPGDYWNTVAVAWNSDHTEWDLKFASGESCPTQVRLINLGGCWGNSGGMGVRAPMLDCFNYPVGNQGGNSQVILTEVPPGKYDLYLYGHGIDPLYYGDYTLTVGERPYGRKTTSKRRDAVKNISWVEGSQYVRFRAIQVRPGERMDILIRPGGEVTDRWGRKVSDAMICGLQLVPIK